MALLQADRVSVRYGGIKALDQVSIRAQAGQVTGLIGPNGAGKSTLVGVLSGLVRPQAGSVILDGRDVTSKRPHQRARMGMARTFQRLELWGSMTVGENVRTAAELASRWLPSGFDPVASAETTLALVGLADLAGSSVAELSSGQGRLVEVARALATRPRILLLDEPSAGLNESESRELGTTLLELAASGVAVVMVEHHVELVTTTCSAVYVLDFGTTIARGTPEEVRRNPVVEEAYLGSRHAVGA